MAQKPEPQSTDALAKYSVYTIKAAAKLVEDFTLARKELTYDEERSWVTAGKLWREASEVGKHMRPLRGCSAR